MLVRCSCSQVVPTVPAREMAADLVCLPNKVINIIEDYSKLS
jgi:hypothetical protein